ncbi:hypothetical protein ONE63_007446 [Megalurothrips usitatus]|uniref:Apoptosis regulatory protein Siva n=1 Tax=Megalurothrips usitatus TaxID=439358 RepID=A0AAV7XRZ3_9NEOP|nr:hypothetical protein ONE63_007446 [Megalurothrips usitatus]
MFAFVCPTVNMVKRSCPFTDDMNPQMKVHVSEKEVAEGVMSDQHMKNVYDKTKDLLFLGARKKSSPQSSVETNVLQNGQQAENVVVSTHVGSAPSLKQMQLTCQGQLSTPKDNENNEVKMRLPCSRCCVKNHQEMHSCSFCDTPLCISCIRSCTKCEESFCVACSFDMYDGSEGYICRNCC